MLFYQRWPSTVTLSTVGTVNLFYTQRHLSSFNIFRWGRICKLFISLVGFDLYDKYEKFTYAPLVTCEKILNVSKMNDAPLSFVNFLCSGEGVKWNPNSMSRVVPRNVKTTCDQLSAHTSASSGTTNNLERHKSQSDSCVSVKVRDLGSAKRSHERLYRHNQQLGEPQVSIRLLLLS